MAYRIYWRLIRRAPRLRNLIQGSAHRKVPGTLRKGGCSASRYGCSASRCGCTASRYGCTASRYGCTPRCAIGSEWERRCVRRVIRRFHTFLRCREAWKSRRGASNPALMQPSNCVVSLSQKGPAYIAAKPGLCDSTRPIPRRNPKKGQDMPSILRFLGFRYL